MEILQFLKHFASILATQTMIMVVVLLIIFVYLFRLFHLRRAEKRYSPLTENLLRTPAQTLERQFDNCNDRFIFGIVSVVLPIALLIGNQALGVLSWVLLCSMSLAALSYSGKVLRQALVLRLAIDGEQYTGAELNYLMRAGAWVYHDIPFQYGNIDHIVISTGGVFTVETKTARKPEGDRKSRRQWKVQFDGNQLSFPHFQITAPIEQARLQAKHLKQSIKKNLGLDINVTPVVALPGWFIERTGASDTWVISPKRGGALAKQVGLKIISMQQAELIANYVESVARSVPAVSKKMDPDASKY